jgi:hypothetical protein
MRKLHIVATLMLGVSIAALAQEAPSSQSSSAPRVVDLRASEGTILKASYFAAAKPGPGVLLLHQGNRTRQSWNDLAGQLVGAGINTLTLDMRGFGESGGKHQNWPREEKPEKKYARMTSTQPGNTWSRNQESTET